MKKLTFLLSATLVFATTNANIIIKDYSQTLKQNLKKQLQKNGMEKTIEFCAFNAEKISKKIESKYPNTSIKRISLNPRNQKNTPNEEEKVILQTFKKFNKLPEKIIVEKKDKKIIYKPVVINKKVCLKCHGKISENLSKTIKKYYPNDKATGYKLGEMAGAIVVTIKKK